MKVFEGTAPAYADEIFEPVDQSHLTRRSKFKLNLSFRKRSAGQKCLSYIGPKIWNSLSSFLSFNSFNFFKSILLSTKSRAIFSKIYRERKGTYMCSPEATHPLSHSCVGLTIIMLYPKAHSNILYIYISFAITSKGTIMEIRSTQSFNAIPATLIRGVFNLYLNLLYEIYCKYFIYLFIHLFALSFSFNHCNFLLFVANLHLFTYLP